MICSVDPAKSDTGRASLQVADDRGTTPTIEPMRAVGVFYEEAAGRCCLAVIPPAANGSC